MNYKKSLVFAAACIGMAFFGIAFIVMGTVLPTLTEKFALYSVQASSLVTFLPIGVLLGSLFFGPVVDRFGYKMLLVVSTILALLGLEGLSFFDDLRILSFCIFLIGLGGGMLNGATNALASDISEDHERSSKLSILGVFYGVGALGMPLLLGFLSKQYSYQIILQITGLFMLLCVVYFLAIRFPESKIKQGFPINKALKLVKEPALLLMSFFLFFQSGMEGLFNNWTTSYLEKTTEIETSDVILSLTFFVLGMTVARLLLSFILQKTNHALVLFSGMILTLAGLSFLYYTSSFQLAAVGLFLAGFGLSAGFPVILGVIGTIHKEATGTAIGLALFIALSGNTLLNYAMGYVSKLFEIGSFPIFITILLVIQAVIVLSNTKIINNKL